MPFTSTSHYTEIQSPNIYYDPIDGSILMTVRLTAYQLLQKITASTLLSSEVIK